MDQYLASVSVASRVPVPDGMEAWKLPARTYALFTHRGPITRLGDTFNYIYGTWLRRSGRELAADLSLERYDARFGDGGRQSELDILIPIKPTAGSGVAKKN